MCPKSCRGNPQNGRPVFRLSSIDEMDDKVSPCWSDPKHGCPVISIANDSDEEDEDVPEELDDFLGWMNGSVSLPSPLNSMSPIISTDEVSLQKLEAAVAPATAQKPLGGPAQRLPTSESVVRCADGAWDDCEGVLLVTDGESPPVSVSPGDVVRTAWIAPHDWQKAQESADEGETPPSDDRGLPQDPVRHFEQR